MNQQVKSVSSLVLLSGGLDSTANLAFAIEAGEKPFCLTIDYGQRAAPSEKKAARTIADYYGLNHEILDLPWLGALGQSSLTDRSMTIPQLATSQLDHMPTITQSAKSVWVPNRNGVMIETAAAVAESRGIGKVYVGFNAEEAATFPDNTTEYLGAVTASLRYSTANHVQIACFTDRLNKTEIVKKLRTFKTEFPFHLVWSCYYTGEKPCGKCESCQRFQRAVNAGA